MNVNETQLNGNLTGQRSAGMDSGVVSGGRSAAAAASSAAAVAAAAAAAASTVAKSSDNVATLDGSNSSGRSTPSGGDQPHNKLFVGGLSWQTSADKLREYFGQYGTIIDVQVLKDPLTQVKFLLCNNINQSPIANNTNNTKKKKFLNGGSLTLDQFK